MLYSTFLLLALVASNNVVTALPTPKWERDIEKRDPGVWDTVKGAWSAATSPKGDAAVKTCQAGAIWTGVACVAQLVDSSTSRNIGLGAAVVGAAATTQDAASKWTKIYKGSRPKPNDIEMGHPEEQEGLLPPNTPANSHPNTPANSHPNTPVNSHPNTPDNTPPNSRPGTPDSEKHMPGHFSPKR